MSAQQIQQLLISLRRRYAALSETYDLTVQLGEALDRGDRTSFGLVLTLRQEPILQLQATEQSINNITSEFSEEMQKKWRALIDGAPPETDDEKLLVQQIDQNRQIIARLVPLNQRIEQGLTAQA